MNENIFRAYDVRGNSSHDLTDDVVKIIGSVLGEYVRDRKILNAVNQNNKNLILSVRCETKDLDVRILGRKWRGWQPAKEEFEKNLINDFC